MTELESILHICGCRGSRPVCGPQFDEFGGHTTCFVLRQGDQAVVLDCGSGLTNGAKILQGCTRVDVLLTHLHYDHLIGLLDWSVFPAGVIPTFYSTFSDWEGDPLAEFCRPPFWPVGPGKHQLRDVRRGETVSLGAGISAAFYRSGHPNEGNVAVLHTGQRKVAILFDYEHGNPLPDQAEGCDLLVYDGMYSDETYPNYQGWGHSTWQEACRCANRLGAGRLLVTHHAPDSPDRLLRQWEAEAKKIFPQTGFARMNQAIIL